MRKDKVKVGMYICHNETGQLLGQVTKVLDNVVIFDGKIGTGIAGFSKIDTFMEDET